MSVQGVSIRDVRQWPNVATIGALPNVAAAPIQLAVVAVGDVCFVTGTGLLYVCTTATVGAAVWIQQSYISGIVGPWTNVTAALQTDLPGLLGAATIQGWVAPRAGSLRAFSASLDVAVTGANITCVVQRALAATPGTFVTIAASLLTFTATVNTTASVLIASGAQTFAAGDVLRTAYTTLVTTNTPTLVGFVEVEM
jgi:hypothetical protein